MTQESPLNTAPADIAETYKQLTEAEATATVSITQLPSQPTQSNPV